jgi:uncharacterized short protein YbdD (DUF466 family)
MAKPIFIVGWRRTGTTLLTNLICQNSNVACVQGHIPGSMSGVAESAYFSHLAGKFGSLENHNNLILFIEMFCNSTYFELSGLEKDFLYKERPSSYDGLFRLVMDRFSEKKGTDFWLEKTPAHSLHLEEIYRYYRDSKFVAIKRDILKQIQSSMKLREINKISDVKGQKRIFNIVKRIFNYHAAYKHIEHFRTNHPNRIITTTYEDLISSRKEAITAICEFLELEFQENMLESKYRPNTSFSSEAERKQVLSPMEVKIIRKLSFFFNLLPYSLYRMIHLLKRKIEGQKLPSWFFATKIECLNRKSKFKRGQD